MPGANQSVALRKRAKKTSFDTSIEMMVALCHIAITLGQNQHEAYEQKKTAKSGLKRADPGLPFLRRALLRKLQTPILLIPSEKNICKSAKVLKP